MASRADARHTVYDLKGQLLVPGFIDTQVNGGGGVLFNDDPSVESIAAIGRAHRRFGTTGFLPTLISDDLDVVAKAVRAVQTAIAIGVPGVLGIHIEGPFLNEERKGVHDATKLRGLDEDALGLLTSLNGGRTLVTLAPERTSPQIIRKLADAGVIVSAGHTNATYEEIKDALSQGLTGFTHLFNAMSQLTGREPGAVGAALDDADSWCGIIVDGHHVDPVVLRIALRCKRPDRFMLVTDAMPSVGAPKKSFKLQGRPISVADNKPSTRTAASRAPTSTWRAPCAMPSRCSASSSSRACAWRAATRRSSCGSATSSDASRRAARQPRVARRQVRGRRDLDRRAETVRLKPDPHR